MMQTSISKATQDDCSDIARIYNSYLGKATMDLDPKKAVYYRQILKHQDVMEELWVIKKNHVRCWGIIKKYSDRKGYKYAGETSVYCDYEYLNEGHGTAMKRHLMQRCRDLGYHHLVARIFSSNDISIKYNIKLGYTIVGVQKEIGRIDGKWLDVTVMQCIL